MSSQTKRLQKTIENTLRFEADAYFNYIGSYIICSYILNGKGDIKNINKEWRKLKRNIDEIDIKDEFWLQNLCDRFGVAYDTTGRIALVQGNYNMFFMICDEDGNLYTTREDGMMPGKSLEEALQNKTIYRLVGDDEYKEVAQ